MLSTKLALRLALHWQDAWEAHRHPAPAIDNDWNRLAARFETAQRIYRRLGIARNGQFPVGVRRLGKDFAYHLGELAYSANRLRDAITDLPPPPADLASWLADVRQLEGEFSGIEVRWRERVARVVTEPITLRGIELGPFAIDFFWDRLGSAKGVHCFEFIALEPNPAAGRDDVVHPHVNGRDLCAGDAAGPLERALGQGRFPEAFLILRSVLGTYNAGSPYVKLDVWEGSPCRDCGVRVRDDDRYSCEACDADMCERCAGSCAACGTTRCDGCLETCSVCDASCCSGCLELHGDERVCTRCFANCVFCGGRVPRDQLVDRHCPDCTLDEEETDDDDSDPATIQAGVEVD